MLNDIAILKLTNKVRLDRYVQIACLPDPTLEVYPASAGVKGYIAGWGIIKSSPKIYPQYLQNANITIFDRRACSNVMRSMTKDWNAQICAGDWNGLKDSCEGFFFI